jgi:N-acetylneuraminic acid mutarotase
MGKLNLLIAAFVFAGLATYAQNNLVFRDLATMNLARGLITCATDGNNIYVSNGFSPDVNYTTEIEKYSIASDSWSIFANSLQGKRFPSSEVIDNNLYLFNGLVDTYPVYNNKMEVVNLSNGTVTYSTDNPMPARSSGSAVWNKKIYIFGGSSGSSVYSDKLQVFDPSNQTWTELANMPEAKETKGEIVDGKLFVIGGYNDTTSSRIDMYDIQNNTWVFIMNMPDGVSSHATTVSGNKIWIVGDYTNLTYLAYFDVSSNEFNVVQSNMTGRRHAGAAAINGKLYIMGGNQTSYGTSCLSSLQMADLTSAGIRTINEKEISYYPNPAGDILYVDGLEKNTNVTICDLNGKMVLHNPHVNNNQIDVSRLKSGLYTLKIIRRSGVATGIFAKQ